MPCHVDKGQFDMEQIVKIACKGADTIPLDNFRPFQGKLKSLDKEDYEKLKKEIIELDFSEPISVWKNEGKINILNGHQRIRVLQQMKKEGWIVPDLPVSYIEADTYEQAKKKVLALASQYGKVTDEGLYEYCIENKIDIEELNDSYRFPEIDLLKFRDSYSNEPLEVDINEKELDENIETNNSCPSCGYEW